jgi:hypothetical protein
LRGDTLADLRTKILRHRSLADKRLSRFFHARGVVDHEPRGFDVDGHFRELELDRLEFRDRFTKLLALFAISEGGFKRSLGEPDHLRTDADSAFIKRFDRDFVSLPNFANDIGAGTRTSSRINSQVELARMPSLSSFLPTLKPGSRVQQ